MHGENLKKKIITFVHGDYFIWQLASILHCENFAWRRAAQRLPPIQFAVCRGLCLFDQCFAVNISLYSLHLMNIQQIFSYGSQKNSWNNWPLNRPPQPRRNFREQRNLRPMLGLELRIFHTIAYSLYGLSDCIQERWKWFYEFSLIGSTNSTFSILTNLLW